MSENLNRRDVLKGAAGISAAAALGMAVPQTSGQPARTATDNPIRRENAHEGSHDWQLTRIRLDHAEGYRSPAIEGFCSRQSVAAGETLEVFVSAKPSCRFTLEIFRMGYYDGRGARLMRTFDGLDAATQPDPPVGEHRLRECQWDSSVSLRIPDDWISGVYLGRLSREPRDGIFDPWQSYVVFIVRDERPADILFQCSDNTWQAYNRWPDTFSLYDNGEPGWDSGPGTHVSFDRPYGKYRQIYDNPQSVGSGEFLCWEFPLAFWLEQHGYDVTYGSNADMVAPDRAQNCQCFISVGHDEYWDRRQYDSVKSLIDGGMSALFFSGNSICWESPFSAASDGREKRIITRAAPYGGYGRENERAQGRFDHVGPDEGLIMGARNVEPVNGGGDWICTLPEHWLFAGTGMRAGEAIPGLVGWEYHGNPADLPGLEVVAGGTALKGGTVPQEWTATLHPGPHGNFVFNAATIFWAQGLSSPPGHMLPWSHWTRPHGPDQRVQHMTHNLLKKALS